MREGQKERETFLHRLRPQQQQQTKKTFPHIAQAKRGGLKDTSPDDLLSAVFEATLQRTGVDPKDIGDIVIGSVLGDSSQRAIQCRIAALLSGIPDTVPIHTVNRQCSSGLQAIASVAAAIKAGFYSVGLAGGVESMSTNPMAWEGGINPRVSENENAQNCLLPMGRFRGEREREKDWFFVAGRSGAFCTQEALRCSKNDPFFPLILPSQTQASLPRTSPRATASAATSRTSSPPARTRARPLPRLPAASATRSCRSRRKSSTPRPRRRRPSS